MHPTVNNIVYGMARPRRPPPAPPTGRRQRGKTGPYSQEQPYSGVGPGPSGQRRIPAQYPKLGGSEAAGRLSLALAAKRGLLLIQASVARPGSPARDHEQYCLWSRPVTDAPPATPIGRRQRWTTPSPLAGEVVLRSRTRVEGPAANSGAIPQTRAKRGSWPPEPCLGRQTRAAPDTGQRRSPRLSGATINNIVYGRALSPTPLQRHQPAGDNAGEPGPCSPERWSSEVEPGPSAQRRIPAQFPELAQSEAVGRLNLLRPPYTERS
jgi:hypothetical protein